MEFLGECDEQNEQQLKLLEEEDWSLFELCLYLINGPFTVTLVILGLLLNILVILAFNQPIKSIAANSAIPAINCYLITLAVWDMALLLGALFLYALPIMYGLNFGWLTHFMPYVYYLAQTTLIGSVWVILVLSIDRYMALCQPLKWRQKAARSISASDSAKNNGQNRPRGWLLLIVSGLAGVYGLPNLFRITVENINCATLNGTISTMTHLVESPVAKQYWFSHFYQIYCTILFSILPYLIVLVLTLITAVELHRHSVSRCPSSNSPMNRTPLIRKHSKYFASLSVPTTSLIGTPTRTISISSSIRQLDVLVQAVWHSDCSNKILLTIVLKFIGCRFLVSVLDVVDKTRANSANWTATMTDMDVGPWFAVLSALSNLLVVVNATSNFGVYYWNSVRFRRAIHQLIRCGQERRSMEGVQRRRNALTEGLIVRRKNGVSARSVTFGMEAENHV